MLAGQVLSVRLLHWARFMYPHRCGGEASSSTTEWLLWSRLPSSRAAASGGPGAGPSSSSTRTSPSRKARWSPSSARTAQGRALFQLLAVETKPVLGDLALKPGLRFGPLLQIPTMVPRSVAQPAPRLSPERYTHRPPIHVEWIRSTRMPSGSANGSPPRITKSASLSGSSVPFTFSSKAA